jgi:hypothetical protein
MLTLAGGWEAVPLVKLSYSMLYRRRVGCAEGFYWVEWTAAYWAVRCDLESNDSVNAFYEITYSSQILSRDIG